MNYTLFGIIIASFRIYLELINFDFLSLPMSKKIAETYGSQKILEFHKMGLFFSVGYVVLFSPSLLF